MILLLPSLLFMEGHLLLGTYSIQAKKVLEPYFLLLPIGTIQNEDGSPFEQYSIFSDHVRCGPRARKGEGKTPSPENWLRAQASWSLVNLQLHSSEGWKLPGAPRELQRSYFANPETDILINCK